MANNNKQNLFKKGFIENKAQKEFERLDRAENNYDYEIIKYITSAIATIEKAYAKRKDELDYHWSYREAKKNLGEATG